MSQCKGCPVVVGAPFIGDFPVVLFATFIGEFAGDADTAFDVAGFRLEVSGVPKTFAEPKRFLFLGDFLPVRTSGLIPLEGE